MGKIKFTKGELKRQRDSLRQYERYLPTLQLKKQQLQMEILQQLAFLEKKEHVLTKKIEAAKIWIGLANDKGIDFDSWIKPQKPIIQYRNIAGVELSVFISMDFLPVEYDLFTVPLWVDSAIEQIKNIVLARAEVMILDEGINILKKELRIVTQRVNLFEKVKIPCAKEAIRLIKIYIGDQMANAVGRSKIAKRKLEEAFAGGVLV